MLRAFEDAAKNVEYYALDLDRKELERTLAQLPAYKFVRSHGLWGTYDDGREWLKLPSNLRKKKCVLSLGSSIGERSSGAGENQDSPLLTLLQETSIEMRPRTS